MNLLQGMALGSDHQTRPEAYAHGQLVLAACSGLILVHLWNLRRISAAAPLLRIATLLAILQLSVYSTLHTLDTSCPPVLQAVVFVGAVAWCVLITDILVRVFEPHFSSEQPSRRLVAATLVMLVLFSNAYAGFVSVTNLKKFADTRTCWPRWIPRVPWLRAKVTFVTLSVILVGFLGSLKRFRSDQWKALVWMFAMMLVIVVESGISVAGRIGSDATMAAWVIAFALELLCATSWSKLWLEYADEGATFSTARDHLERRRLVSDC